MRPPLSFEKARPLAGVTDQIERKLKAAFAPTRLVVTDESHKHAGHAGAKPEGETHFHVAIESAAFMGIGRVASQRLVYEALKEELAGHVHALSLSAKAPNGS